MNKTKIECLKCKEAHPFCNKCCRKCKNHCNSNQVCRLEMNSCLTPKIVPAGWQIIRQGLNENMIREYPDGLVVAVSVEVFGEGCKDFPPMGIGEYTHISISRRDKYPSWDEMRDYIYSSSAAAWLDKKRDVVMLLPPKEKYVNFHSNTFHFYQKRRNNK